MKPDEDIELFLRLKTTYKDFSSEELLDIWNENDRYSYRDEAFSAIRDILSSRNLEIPEQKQVKQSKQHSLTSTEKKEIMRGAACVASGIGITALCYFTKANYIILPTGLIICGLYILIKHQILK